MIPNKIDELERRIIRLEEMSHCHTELKKKAQEELTFMQVIKLLKDGKKARKKSWEDDIKFIFEKDGYIDVKFRHEGFTGGWIFRISETEATDWEIVGDES